MPPTQAYAFLSEQPSSTKRSAGWPTYPTETGASGTQVARRRSVAATAINTWAAGVQPGAPAPHSPSRLEPVSEPQSRSVRSTRRKSQPAPLPPTPVAYLPQPTDSPTSSEHSVEPVIKPNDLPAVGYTSIFVSLPPQTPPADTCTPDRRRSIQVAKMSAPATPSTPSSATQPASKGGFLRSLALKPSSKSAVGDATSSAPKSKPVKEKKSKHEERPSPVDQELMLMQFMGGGSIARNEKRYAEKQAKAAGATKVNGQLVGVPELHRDARGGRWRDQDEELEFRGLLADSDPLDTSAHPSSRSSKSRHRPEPLSLVPQNTDRRVESARREFLDSSFNPTSKPIFSGPNPSSVTIDSHASKRSGFKRLFKSRST
jgi:hypothetical protein